MRRTSRVAVVVVACWLVVWAVAPRLGAEPAGAVAFAIIGDFGTGSSEQYDLAREMIRTRDRVPYSIVLTVGDNIYGGWNHRSVVERFETPYEPLLDAGVSFFASLGNHDAFAEREYPLFNMNGRRYYRIRRGPVDFFALDSNYMDAAQLTWLRDALHSSTAPWKIAFFHHPLYSSAHRHGSEDDLRAVLEPILVANGVQVVFSGHDHVYERVKPQMGVSYFVCGSSGQLRRGDLRKGSALTATGFDQDLAFIVATVVDDELRFETVSRTGAIVDAGEIQRALR
jgi:3',5'-cyclic AMP phosphodiesterase CpdA